MNKKIFLIALFLLLSTPPPLVHATTLKLNTDKTTYKFGDTIIITATLRNPTTETAKVYVEYVLMDLQGRVSTARMMQGYDIAANETRSIELYNMKIDERFYSGQYIVTASIIEKGARVDEEEVRFDIVGAPEDMDIRLFISSDADFKTIGRAFIKGEKIYLSISNAPANAVITANLTSPDNSTQKIVLPTSITPKQVGSYKIDLKATVQAYRDASLTEYFAVLEKSPDILADAKETSSISLKLDKNELIEGEEVTASGAITPSHADTTVTLTYLKDGKPETTRTTTTDDNGLYKNVYKLTGSGSWTIQASWQGDSNHLSAESEKRSLNVQAPPSFNWLLILPIIIALTAVMAFILIRRTRAE